MAPDGQGHHPQAWNTSWPQWKAKLDAVALQEEAVAFFTEMAKEYGERPHVIYEIFNEPDKDATWQEVKDYAKAVIGAIRQHDPDNLVIVGSCGGEELVLNGRGR
jgi:hypothetical protein